MRCTGRGAFANLHSHLVDRRRQAHFGVGRQWCGAGDATSWEADHTAQGLDAGAGVAGDGAVEVAAVGQLVAGAHQHARHRVQDAAQHQWVEAHELRVRDAGPVPAEAARRLGSESHRGSKEGSCSLAEAT